MSEEVAIRPGEDLRVLVVDKVQSATDEVSDFLRDRGVSMKAVDFKKGVHKAMQLLVKEDYDYCFISESYDSAELKSFFEDYDGLNKEHVCLFFFLVNKRKGEDTKYEEQLQIGFHGIVSRKGTHSDFESLREAERKFGRLTEITKRKVNVNKAIDHLLKHLDQAAADVRRGVKHTLNTISSDFIGLQTNYDDEVLDKYYKQLETKAGDYDPETVFEVEVPQQVLEKNLPGLEERRYKGVSRRVWEKIKKMHGIQGDAPNPGSLHERSVVSEQESDSNDSGEPSEETAIIENEDSNEEEIEVEASPETNETEETLETN